MLLDTCIVVDFLRGVTAAQALIASLDERPVVSAITIAELFAGFRSQRSERIARGFLRECTVLGIDARLAEDAGAILRHYQAGHGLDVPDALIAATAEHHGLALATLNIKHFPMFPRLKPAY